MIEGQNLNGDLAPQARVPGRVDDAHAAVAEFGAEGVRAEGGAWGEGHGRGWIIAWVRGCPAGRERQGPLRGTTWLVPAGDTEETDGRQFATSNGS